MYNLLPLISTKTIYRCIFKIKKEDSRKIVENLDILIGDYKIEVAKEENNEYLKFYISSESERDLQVFYYKISSIANDNYIRRNKIEKNFDSK